MRTAENNVGGDPAIGYQTIIPSSGRGGGGE